MYGKNIFWSRNRQRSKGFAKNKHITSVNSKGQYEDFDMRNIFHFPANKTHFHMKGLVFSLVVTLKREFLYLGNSP